MATVNNNNNNNNNNNIEDENSNENNDEKKETLILLDSLHKQKKYQEIFEKLVQLLEIPENQLNIDILWRYARSCFDLAFGLLKFSKFYYSFSTFYIKLNIK